MSKSLEKIGYTVFEEFTNHHIVDDEKATIEIIFDMVHDVRNLLIDRELKKFRRLDPMFYTVCPCIPVLCKSITCLDEEGETVESGVVEYYSEADFLQNYLGVHSVKYLGTPDYKNPFRLLNFPFGIGSSKTKHVSGFVLVNNKIIYENIDPEIKVLTLVAITKTGNCSNDNCDLSAPYNIPQHLIHELEGLVLKRLLTTHNIKRDLINDAQKLA